MTTDVDIVIITDVLDLSDIRTGLESAETTLGRRVIPVMMTTAEWIEGRYNPVSFVARIYPRPRMFIIGSENSLPS